MLEIAWPLLAWFTNRAFAEDCAVVEKEQAAYDEQSADWNQEVFPPIRDLRKLLSERGKPLPSSIDGMRSSSNCADQYGC